MVRAVGQSLADSAMMHLEIMSASVPDEANVGVGVLRMMRAPEQSLADSAMMHLEMFLSLEPEEDVDEIQAGGAPEAHQLLGVESPQLKGEQN